MSIEHAEPEAVNDVERETTVTGAPTPTEVAVQNARRAADHAVMAIFELAFLIQSLDQIICRYNGETERQLD